MDEPIVIPTEVASPHDSYWQNIVDRLEEIDEIGEYEMVTDLQLRLSSGENIEVLSYTVETVP